MSTLALTANRTLFWLSENRARLRRAGLMIGLALFVGGLYMALRENPDLWQRLSLLHFLVLLGVLQPIGTAVSAADFQVLARLSGAKVPFGAAFRVTLYGNAANMLPIPGSMAARLGALKLSGVTLRRGAGLIALLTLIWGGLAFCYAGAWLSVSSPLPGGAFGAVGVGILSCTAILTAHFQLPRRMIGTAVGLRLVLVVLEAIVIMVAMHAVGLDAGVHQTSVLVVAGFLAAVVPAGIGVRETIVALLSPMVGIDPATGFLAATAGRIVGLTWLAVASAIAFFALRRKGSE